jgi:preprotein translocase subunit SecG
MNILEYLVMILLFVTSLFLILLVLVQRGRGGGLAGAFGGLGGQSAFGTKAGDLFTRITIGVAAFWIILCAFAVKLFNEGGRNMIAPDLGRTTSTAPETPGGKATKAAPASGSQAAPAGSAPASAPAATAPAGGTTPDAK